MTETQLFLPEDMFNSLTVTQLEQIRNGMFDIIKKVTSVTPNISIYRN